MQRCPFQSFCPYYNNAIALPLGSWETLVSTYCTGDAGDCARYQVYHELKNFRIPTDLKPHQQGRAHEIISCAMYSS